MKFISFTILLPTTSFLPFNGTISKTKEFLGIFVFFPKNFSDGFFKYNFANFMNLLKFSIEKDDVIFLVLSTGSIMIKGETVFDGFNSSNGFFSFLLKSTTILGSHFTEFFNVFLKDL